MDMCLSLVCQEFCAHLIALFYTDPKTCRSNYAYSSSPQCLDYHHITFCTPVYPYPDMPWSTFSSYQHQETNTYSGTAYSLQHHFTLLLPPTYHNPHWAVNISLLSASIHMINISSLDFHVWHHLEHHHNDTQLQHLSTIPSILVSKLYLHLLNSSHQITPFATTDESADNTDSIWTLFSHTGIQDCLYQQDWEFSVVISFGVNMPD